MIEWKSFAVPITLEPEKPLRAIQAPLDRRHRWLYRREDTIGFWYRCARCGKRKRVRKFANLLARKMRDAARNLDDSLTEMLWVT